MPETTESNPYDVNLDRSPANHQPPTPLTFFEPAAAVFPSQTTIVHGALRRGHADFYTRSRQPASALAPVWIGRGDTASAPLSNTPAMLECHYGVPMCGGVLHSIDTRLDAAIIAFQLDHASSRIVIVDRELMPLMQEALALASVSPAAIQDVDRNDPEVRSARTSPRDGGLTGLAISSDGLCERDRRVGLLDVWPVEDRRARASFSMHWCSGRNQQ